MIRNIDLNEISDGKLYDANDMVKADCHNCVGCSACCSKMGESIVLDPMDVHRITKGLNVNFQELLGDKLEINIVDGLALPNIKMSGENEVCGFLNEEGRCNIHSVRPGICRLFPLGRYYAEDTIKYFLQVYECPVTDKSKIKVKKWIGIENIKQYEDYIWSWHCFIKECREAIMELSNDQIRILNILILRTFYESEYEEEFYNEFNLRLEKIKKQLGI